MFGTLFRRINTSPIYQTLRFATKKAGGSTKNGRDSPGKRLGLKKYGGEKVYPGNIIYRQRGQHMRCGKEGVKMGRDYTIYAVVEGWVKFKWDPRRRKQCISVSSHNPNILPLSERLALAPVEDVSAAATV